MRNALLTGATRLRAALAAGTYRSVADSTPFVESGSGRPREGLGRARKVKTPTLIMGDVGDSNVPLVNSYEWYHALRDNGVPVRFYGYPANTHFPGDIVRTTDIFRRWVGWMSSHLH